MMTKYLSIMSLRFRSALQYRAAAIAGMVTQVFFGFIMVMVMDAFYGGSSSKSLPMDFRQVMNYIWLGQAFLALLPWNVDKDIQELINSGNISYELVRPLSLYPIWFARTVGWRTASTLLRSVPLLLFVFFILPLLGLREYAMTLPPNWSCFAVFLTGLILAVFLAASISVFMNILTIWTISGTGIASSMGTLVTLLSGMIIPLPLFPDLFQPLLAFLPFRGLVDAPFRLYSGNIPPAESIGVFLHQISWSIAFITAGILMLKPGFRRLSVQGG